MFREYPYLNLQDLNLDYILRKIREMQTELNNFVVTNAIKYADPIDWNITTQYEKNTVVIDANSGIAYLSVNPVPSGVAITNTDYWTVIFDLSMFIDKAAKNLTAHVEGQTNTATFNSAVGDWLIWYDVLYKVIAPITAGDAYVINSNIERITVEDVIKAMIDNINILTSKIDNMKIVNVLDYGAKGDGATDDTDAINACIESFANIGYVPYNDRKEGVMIYCPSGRYMISNSIIIYPFMHFMGDGLHATEMELSNDAAINCSMFKTYNYDSFVVDRDTFYNPQGVPCDFSVENMSLYGNATNLTNSNCFNIYGYNWRIENVEVYYFGDTGVYVDYDTNYNDYYYMDDTKFYESVLNNVYIRQCGNKGIEWHGLTDAYIDNVNVSECNGACGVEIFAPIYINNIHIYGCGDNNNVSAGIALHSNCNARLITTESNTGAGFILAQDIWNVSIDTLEAYNNKGVDVEIGSNCNNINFTNLLITRLQNNNYALSNSGTLHSSNCIIRSNNTITSDAIYNAIDGVLKLDYLKIIDFENGTGLKIGQGGASYQLDIHGQIINCNVAIESGAGLSDDNTIVVDIIKNASQTAFSWALTYYDNNVILVRMFDGSSWSIVYNHYPPHENELQLGSNNQIDGYVSGVWQGLPFMRYASNHYEYYDAGTSAWIEKYPTGYVAFDTNSNHLVYWDGANWTQVPQL